MRAPRAGPRAPLIDLESGFVVGVHIAGKFLEGNYAVAAWELDRDPQWKHISNKDADRDVADPAAVSRQAIGTKDDKKTKRIFSFDEIIDLHKKFVEAGVTDDSKIAVLFRGLPAEYVGALPSDGSPVDKLLARLHVVNETGGRIAKHSAFYYLLMNSERMHSWDSDWTGAAQILLATVLEQGLSSRSEIYPTRSLAMRCSTNERGTARASASIFRMGCSPDPRRTCRGDCIDWPVHLSLNKDAPVLRAVQTVGRILSTPILGGLQH